MVSFSDVLNTLQWKYSECGM